MLSCWEPDWVFHDLLYVFNSKLFYYEGLEPVCHSSICFLLSIQAKDLWGLRNLRYDTMKLVIGELIFVCEVNLLDKDGFTQFKLSHFYIDWSAVFRVSLNFKELLWNKEICFYSSVQPCFPFFCLSLPHTSFLKIFSHESTLFRLFPHFFLGTFVETMKSKAPVSSGCCPVLTLLPCAWGPDTPDPPPHWPLSPPPTISC